LTYPFIELKFLPIVRGQKTGKSVRRGHSPRYCNRRQIPDNATALRGGKAGEEDDPKVRIPGFEPFGLSFLRVEEKMT